MKSRGSHCVNSPSFLGDAIQISFLLSDWNNFGLSERVCYHYDLIGILAGNSPTEESETLAESGEKGKFHGVVSLLECVPFMNWRDLTKNQRKGLRNMIRDFNLSAEKVRENGSKTLHQPKQLPLRISPTTRVSFAYEMTRMAFVLDASPTLVSTFGASSTDQHFCAIDRAAEMVKQFFQSLAKPILTTNMTEGTEWRPILTVTVLAVYPGGKSVSQSILVRDYKLLSNQCAELLAVKIKEWLLSEVETNIALRLNKTSRDTEGLVGYETWTNQKFSSDLRELLDAGDVALDFLPSWARPCIVVATDCRSVACEEILDLFTHEERQDVPIHIMDLSSPSSHDVKSEIYTQSEEGNTNCLTSDPGGALAYPLYMQDDAESLYAIARATAGCFFNIQLLDLVSKTHVGQVQPGSQLALDPFLGSRRRSLRPNALQWYIFFSLSQLTSTTLSASTKALVHQTTSLAGRLVPPDYLCKQMGIAIPTTSDSRDELDPNIPMSVTSAPLIPTHLDKATDARRPHRMTFSTYVVDAIRIKGLLLARIKEGYRAKLYGASTYDDFDKVSIQLTLAIERGTALHYELQYKARENPLVGVAHVKVELSGFRNYVQNIKNDFLAYTTGRDISTRLCKALWWVRRDDLLQSNLCPIEWGDKLSSDGSPFIRRLGSLSHLQLARHYRAERFDAVCTGRQPYAHEEELPFSDFLDDGEQDFFSTVSEWASLTIEKKKKYAKKIPTTGGLTAYCVIEICRSPIASRLFSITFHTIDGTDIQLRQAAVSQLKNSLRKLRNVAVLSKQMCGSLVKPTGIDYLPERTSRAWRYPFLETHFDHEEWLLIKDPELLDLLMRRRSEIGNFFLLHSTDSYALFAKDISVETGRQTNDPMKDVYLVGYQIRLRGQDKEPIINMHVEREVGIFSTDKGKSVADIVTRAHRLFLRVKRRDLECSKALRSRTNLLNQFSHNSKESTENLLEDIERLLKYASCHSRRLRFFENFSVANDELEKLTVAMMLSDDLATDVIKFDFGLSQKVGNQDVGHWFFIRIDRFTNSFIYLPLCEKVEDREGNTHNYRELTFFTFGISDLYCARDENLLEDDEDESHGHISHYLGVEEFADQLVSAHLENYARAGYQALRSPLRKPEDKFSAADWFEIQRVCEYKEVAQVSVNQELCQKYDHQEQSKLMQTIARLFAPVPGRDDFMFYSVTEPGLESMLLGTKANMTEEEINASFDDELSSDESDGIGKRSKTPEPVQSIRYAAFQAFRERQGVCFIHFSLDNKDISYHQLFSITKSTMFQVHMSVFKESNRLRHMPELQASVAVELEAALKSYIAEQTLGRLRAMGRSIQDIDLEVVRKCLRKAREVRVSFFDVHFYVANIDKVIPAGSSAESETEIEGCFNLLLRELESSPQFNLRPSGDECFCLTPPNEEGDHLEYWSFITIKKSRGVVIAEVYHPEGLKKTSSILNSVQGFIIKTTHRTNQLLLLQKLHRTRVASSYLIQSQGQNQKDKSILTSENNLPFEEGHFSCPVVFEESYTLFHRCSAANIIASVVSTTLHSFAVSNRRRFFVYKDESMGIFYLSLEEVAIAEGEHEKVKFLVFGIQQPGPSVTIQLSRLLQRKILMLEVDTWSTVLTKNPQFSWKAADIEFLKTFRSRWSHLEEDSKEKKINKSGYWFKLPPSVYDPLSVIMYFQQNLCGSTFFHRLNTSIEEEECTPSSTFLLGGEDGVEISFCPNEFLLFYNNAPSPLDPKYQACTLTEQGKKYSRQTGSGVALIKLMLMDTSETFGDSTNESRMNTTISESPLGMSLHSILAEEVCEPPNAQALSDCRFFVKIIITDTSLNSEALKNWMFLTLNQSIVSWAIERHIQSASTGGLCSSSLYPGNSTSSTDSTSEFFQEIEALSPGLPLLKTILQAATSLPHPALETVQFDTVLKSSSVTSHTINLLQDCIMGSFPASKNYMDQTVVIRLSRVEKPQIVKMVKTQAGEVSSLRFKSSHQTQKAAGDSPIHCPEYLCYFCSELYSGSTGEEKKHSLPLLFREVIIGDTVSDKRLSLFSQRLSQLKKERPNTFRRSFAFILLVKRNTRSLIMYNWDTKLRKNVILKMKELEASSVIELENNMCSIQLRCLRDLAPLVQKAKKTLKPPGNSINPTVMEGDPVSSSLIRKPEERIQRSPPTRRIQRPTSIRRPKLVEKSMEGGAMQAMAKARAKARAQTAHSRSSSTKNMSTLSTRKQVIQRIPESEKSKIEVEESDLLQEKLINAKENPWESSFGVRKLHSDFLCKNWFRPNRGAVGVSVRDVILLQTKPLWTNCCKIMKQTCLLSTDLPTGFTQHLETLLKSIGLCKVAPTVSSRDGEAQKPMFLMVAVRNSVMTTFLVFRIFASKDVMHCDVWMLKFPRADGKIIKRRKNSVASGERRCSALGTKIGIANEMITNLDAQLFDYSATLVEKSAQLVDEDVLSEDCLTLTEELLKTYPFKKQQELPRLKFRAFDAHVVLRSYGDRFIDKFDALSLFENLYHLRSDCMVACGVDSIYFRTTIEMYDTITLCFLKRLNNVKDKMLLVYLCRTEGVNLDQHVFPSGSTTAETIFKLIVIAGARLAYTALRTSAINMHRDFLWKKASDRILQTSPETLKEMLSIVSARSVFDSNDMRLLLTDRQLGVDPQDLFLKMSSDICFTPKHQLEVRENSCCMLFYNSKFDLFLLFEMRYRKITDLILVQREEITDNSGDDFLNVFKNYVLYYLWKS